MQVKWIEYKGKKILSVDYRGANSLEDMVNVLHQEVNIEKTLKEKTVVLANFEGTHGSGEYMSELKKLGKEVRNEKTSKTALLGITGVKKVLLSAYIAFTGDKNLRPFDNEEDALAWLIL